MLDSPLAEFEIGAGARLTLYANRLMEQSGDVMEMVPLAQVASVRVAFERNPGRLYWAVALLIAAIFFAAISGPLQGWISGAAAKIAEHARKDSLELVLLGIFTALGGLASLLPVLAAALALGAIALTGFFWLGVTVLTLAFAATERHYEVRGRNRYLVEFAQLVAEQLALRKA